MYSSGNPLLLAKECGFDFADDLFRDFRLGLVFCGGLVIRHLNAVAECSKRVLVVTRSKKQVLTPQALMRRQKGDKVFHHIVAVSGFLIVLHVEILAVRIGTCRADQQSRRREFRLMVRWLIYLVPCHSLSVTA